MLHEKLILLGIYTFWIGMYIAQSIKKLTFAFCMQCLLCFHGNDEGYYIILEVLLAY